MIKRIKPPKKIQGILNVPPDKSITHRAVLFSALSRGTSTIHNPLQSEDCLSTLSCIEALGCRVEKAKGTWTITSPGLGHFQKPNKPFDCGNSGTTMRLLSGILAAQDFESVLIGDPSLSKRPMNRISEPLGQMGALFSLHEDRYPPIKIKGSPNPQPIQWNNRIASAQVKSAVLLAALHAKGKTVYSEPSLSRDHTERMLLAAGGKIEEKEGTLVLEGPQFLKPVNWSIPGDFSSASFFIMAGLLKTGSQVEIPSVNINPTRTGLLDLCTNLGAQIDIKNKKEMGGEPLGDIHLASSPLRPFSLSSKLVPRLIDEIPILAVAATQTKGTSSFDGIGELRIKETDRISAVVKNLSAMGAQIEERENGIVIKGPTPLKGASLSSFGDHRIAMAFAVAALLAEGETTLEDAESVSISYPSFWKDLEKVCVS
ncbi:3-phosphoshikimate 1-carboxyvinyltransferase [bacterium F11]|nr:3-phosphoshikimate 1-carboxyvinyltransferase [bacterium F11]